jgi:hypothetical protein
MNPSSDPSSGASPGGGRGGCVVAAGGFGGAGAWACAAAHITVAISNHHPLAELNDDST